MRKKVKTWKKVAVTGAVAATLVLGFWASKAFYEVKEVVDGDTFVTKENQYVRFDKIDAPEIENCMGKEAKEELTRLIVGKKVFIKVRYIEPERARLIASVYSTNGNIEERMLEKGLATLRGGGMQKVLNKASDKARGSGIGVHSSLCTQRENPENPKCNIKANILHGAKYYRYPGCKQYETTLVQLHFGERWFCTEKEAKAAGFIKGGDCK